MDVEELTTMEADTQGTECASGEDNHEPFIEKYLTDISKTSINKQKYVEDLKYDYEKAKIEVQLKMEELKKIKESNSNLQSYLNSHKYMIDELKKSEEADIKEIEISRETAQILRDEIDKLKQIRNEDLASYEEKVTNMTNKFIEAPFNCNPSLLSEKMKKLLEIQDDVKKTLQNIQNDLQTVSREFSLEQSSHSDLHRHTVLEMTKQEEEIAELTSENEKYKNELQSLEKLANTMTEELKVLKQQHGIEN